jgi:hypothetical protein
MNRYGAQAMSHWKTYDPTRYQAIEDPETFFTELGELAETQIQDLERDLAGRDPANETYLEKVGRLRMARLQAEEQILAELILIPSALPEDQAAGDQSPSDAAGRLLDHQRREARARAQDLQEEIDQELRSDDPPSPPPAA